MLFRSNLKESIEISRSVKELGVDLIDVSTGGLIFDAQIPIAPGYQTPFSQEIRESVGIATSAVGLITDPNQAEEIISKGQADAVMIGRAALRNPHWAQHVADTLNGPEIRPTQYLRASARK